jgi:hypothetical protein
MRLLWGTDAFKQRVIIVDIEHCESRAAIRACDKLNVGSAGHIF